jgi:hypothetical protein
MLTSLTHPLLMAVLTVGLLGVFIVVVWAVRRFDLAVSDNIATALASRHAPVAAGGVTALVALLVWGSLSEPGIFHDEQAYVLQAEIFAQGRWTGEVPPAPEFFEQAHVFVEPRVAAKYPPGHSLLLAPGIWLGLPGLVPLLLSGVAGALVFAIARRLTEPTAALLTWLLWTTSAECLFWRASYFSQNTSVTLWLLSVWALLNWKASGRPYQLFAIAGSLAWMFLTRPLTAIALGTPIVLYVILTARQRHLHRQVVFAMAIALPVLLLNFLWQERTLGNWLTSPYAEYSRVYFPYVKPGCGVDPKPPVRHNAPEIDWLGRQFVRLHAAHKPEALPAILLQRVFAVLAALGQGWRGFLVVLFALGALRVRGPGLFAVVSAGCLLVGYLIYAHPAPWAVYMQKSFLFFFIASLELVRLGHMELKLERGQLQAVMLSATLLLLPATVSDVLGARRVNDIRSEFHRAAAVTLASVPRREPAVVFVWYPQTHNHHLSLITNTPDYHKAPLWIVHDRGSANDRLPRLTDRTAYRLNTESWTVERLR